MAPNENDQPQPNKCAEDPNLSAGPQLPRRNFENKLESTSGTPDIVDKVEETHPTDSHMLANANVEEKGAAQVSHGASEVKNLGWNKDPEQIPTLVGGLPNEELWTLIRRFNKVSPICMRCLYNY
jgi:hypothetical protein